MITLFSPPAPYPLWPPKNTLYVPVLHCPEFFPIAILLPPLPLERPALHPIKILPLPVALAPAHRPMKIFSLPLVFLPA